MRRKQLPLTGIQRNAPISNGSQEVINLRPKDGAFRPVGSRAGTNQTTIKETKYIHKISESLEAHWFVDGTDIGYRLYTNGATTTTDATFDTTSSSGAAKFSSLGNVVIMIETNSEELQAYVFENDTNTYRLVGDLLPDLLQATIRYNDIGWTGNVYLPTRAYTEGPDFIKLEVDNWWRENYTPNGRILNPVYFRYAYELFDGSIVKHSQPIRVRGSIVDYVREVSGTPGSFYFRFYEREAIFKVIDAGLATIQANYPGIIKSVNVYMSRPHEDWDIADVESGTTPNLYFITTMLPTLLDKIDNFYLVKSIGLAELSTSDVDILDGVELESLTTNTAMPIDNLTAHNIYSDNPFIYNQRLLFSTIKNTLFKGFVPDLSNPDTTGSGTSYRFRTEVTVSTPEGDKIVRSDLSVQTYQTPVVAGLFYCFGYPDQRASKVRILVYYGGSYYYHEDIALKPHKLFNFAYIEDAYWEDDVGVSMQTVADTYLDQNRVQASGIMNPFYYPAINSYRVANSKVISLGTNAVDISAAQFGSYPIYAFTDDGIWTMEIGRGDIFIQSIKPLSRHVCNNGASVIPINGGVVFSTNKGLFVISGAEVLEVSKEAEGAYESPISDLGSKLHQPLIVESSTSTYESTHMPKQRAVTYGDKTYFAFYDDSTGDYYVAELDHTDNSITNHVPSLSSSGTVFDCSMCVDSSGHLYIITTRGLSFYYKKSTNPGDASAWDAEVAVGPGNVTGGQALRNPILFAIGTELVCIGTYDYYNGVDIFTVIWKDYTAAGVWHGQEDRILDIGGEGYAYCNAFLDSDDVLHVSWVFNDTGNYISLHYVKTSDPLVTSSEYFDAEGNTVATEIDDMTVARILSIGDYSHHEVTISGMIIEEGIPYILALLSDGGVDPKLIVLNYTKSTWNIQDIFNDSILPGVSVNGNLCFDGSITVLNDEIKVAFPVLLTNDDGNSVTSIYEWVSTNRGLSWNLIGKHIPAGTDDYTCVTYPIGITNDCFLVAMLGSIDYGAGRSICFFRDNVSQVKFLDYIEDAVIAYNFIENEIIVSNSDYDYTWIFNIDNKMWVKVSQVWDAFVPSFPGYYGYRTIGSVYYRYDITLENTTDPVTVYLETRPLSMDTMEYKQIKRGKVGAMVTLEDNYFFGVSVYGSTDGGITYRLISTVDISEVDYLISIGRSKYSCQFFIVVMQGSVDLVSTFNELVFDIQDKFQKKLR